MFETYFKTTWRNLMKRKMFSLINVMGLAVSITCSVFIFSYIYEQLSYDNYPDHAENIFRVELHNEDNNATVVYPKVDVAVGKGLAQLFPEIVSFTRMSSLSGFFMKYDNNQFKENRIAVADSNFLNFFSIPFLKGDTKTALEEPYTIVITKEFAKKYFGREDPMGKQVNYAPIKTSLKVTGVIDKIPGNSHFHADAFISSSSLPFMSGNQWTNVGISTYVLLNDHANSLELEAKFPRAVAKYVVPEMQQDMGVTLEQARKYEKTFLFRLRPLTSIHLYSHTKYELEPPGNIQYIYIFGALAIFIILLACVNFVNLSTAIATKRSREVGIRKVLGSLKGQLIFQFLAESILISFCAFLISFLLIFLLLPWFRAVSGAEINYQFFIDPLVILSMAGLATFIGILAGIYPAFFISGFQAIKVLKGMKGTGFNQKDFLRNGLVVFQFTVSLMLVIATLVVYKQIHYMQGKALGYNKDQVVIINNAYLLGNNQDAFKIRLLQNTQVSAASNAFGVPADDKMGGTQIFPLEKKDKENHSDIHVNIYHVDYDYIPVLGMEMASGRNFSKDYPVDSAEGVIINESAAKGLGWNDSSAVGRKILRSGQKTLTVVGVVRDFQYASAKQDIAPLMMLLRRGNAFLVKIQTSEMKNVIAGIKDTWDSFRPEGAFEYTFLNENFDALYKAEERTAQIFTAFSGIALFIAGLGLLGLISYTAERRMKEIGIRKVLGSSIQNIIILLTKDFIKLIVIATFIAVPFAWWAMHKWLQDYAYRAKIEWFEIIVSIAMLLIFALFTISFQAVKAAVANPIKSLGNE
jgi:putative ABC transport system permease protein